VIEVRYQDSILDDPAARNWLVKQGVAALLFVAPGDGGTIGLAGHGGEASRRKDESNELPVVKVGSESYGRILRILEKRIAVTLELEMRNRFYDDPNGWNVVADIPGSDPVLKTEIVMLGAHLDSWTLGTGATDNAVGCAIMMDAMRVLKVLDLAPRRTIRLALWSGEEQGALGSRAYVQQHFKNGGSQTASNSRGTAIENISIYFNLDGGTGKIRGVYQQQDPNVSRIFKAWMWPFAASGMRTASPLDVGGGDQNAFASAGIPSFSFIQDPIEYETRTQHTIADVFELVQPEDAQFNSVVIAALAWHAAQRPERFPGSSQGDRNR
jgi:hypothetical protein